MPYRKLVLTTEEIYHVVNRGIAQAPIFRYVKDYQRFLDLLNYYRFNPALSFSHYNRLEKIVQDQYWNNLEKNNLQIVEILAFCLMSNHFHLLLKQTAEQGIKMFLSNVQNGYAKFFNTRHSRFGALFQAMFKAVRIENDEQLLHVSRYIHFNPITAYLVEKENLLSYQWSSLPKYLGQTNSTFANPKSVLDLIKGPKNYKKFLLNQADYQKRINQIKHLCLE